MIADNAILTGPKKACDLRKLTAQKEAGQLNCGKMDFDS